MRDALRGSPDETNAGQASTAESHSAQGRQELGRALAAPIDGHVLYTGSGSAMLTVGRADTMKNLSAVITRHGGPEVLALREGEVPVPGPNQVRLAVKAVGVAFADIYLRRGITPGAPCPPVVPGFDVVGVVDAVGRHVDGVHVGARVAAIVERGGSARYLCVDAASVVPVPASVRDEAAVAVLLNYVTALQMLVRIGHVQPGQAVFVHAAAGGVGTAVLDLGRLLGLRVFGTASIGKHALVRELGGTPLDYRASDFVTEALALVPQRFAVVMDGIGGRNLSRSHALVSDGGTLVSLGFQSATLRASRFAAWPTLATVGWLALRRRRRSYFYAIMRFNRGRADALRSDIEFQFDRLANGELSPVITDVLPMAAIAEAHAALERGDTRGKLVLRVEA